MTPLYCWGNTNKTSTAMTPEHSTAILHWRQTDCGLVTGLSDVWMNFSTCCVWTERLWLSCWAAGVGVPLLEQERGQPDYSKQVWACWGFFYRLDWNKSATGWPVISAQSRSWLYNSVLSLTDRLLSQTVYNITLCLAEKHRDNLATCSWRSESAERVNALLYLLPNILHVRSPL